MGGRSWPISATACVTPITGSIPKSWNMPELKDQRQATVLYVFGLWNGGGVRAPLTDRLPRSRVWLAALARMAELLTPVVNQEEIMGGPGELAGDQLRAIVERIEHVEEEIRGTHRSQEGNLSGGQGQRLRREGAARSRPTAQAGPRGTRRTGIAARPVHAGHRGRGPCGAGGLTGAFANAGALRPCK